MTGNEFLRRIKRLGRERDIAVRFDPSPGKGSHGALYYGGRRTTLKDLRKEISFGLLRDMLVQLGAHPPRFGVGNDALTVQLPRADRAR